MLHANHNVANKNLKEMIPRRNILLTKKLARPFALLCFYRKRKTQNINKQWSGFKVLGLIKKYFPANCKHAVLVLTTSH